MPLDYILDIPCEPKRRFGIDGLLDRLRLLATLEAGVEPRPGDAAAIREAMFELRPIAFHCARCPANHLNREFGCYGCVETPITAEAEEWLIELLPASLNPRDNKSPAAKDRAERVRLLAQEFREHGISGKPVDERRRSGNRGVARADAGFTLELPRPVVRKYGALLRRIRITSSQLLHYLFLYGELEPKGAEEFCRALGIWEDGGEGDDGTPEVVFTQPEELSDDPSVADLKRFFLALIIACSLNVSVRTSVTPERPSDPAPLPDPE